MYIYDNLSIKKQMIAWMIELCHCKIKRNMGIFRHNRVMIGTSLLNALSSGYPLGLVLFLHNCCEGSGH